MPPPPTERWHGLLVFDKPTGPTSRDLVNRVQGQLPRGTKVGHCGTLDPLATGVLVVAVGQATRLTEYVQRMGKTYRTRLTLGARSDTDDADGTVTPVSGAAAPDPARVAAVLKEFEGVIEQVPPAYSAARVEGRRAYDLARGGEEVSLAARPVRIDRLTVDRYEYPDLELTIDCGKGTYIRSIARDVGERLGCGAYVATLRRTRIGGFRVEDALPPAATAEEMRQHLRPPAEAVAELPPIVVSDVDLRLLQRGQSVSLPMPSELASGQDVAVCDAAGQLVAVARWERGRWLLPVKVLG